MTRKTLFNTLLGLALALALTGGVAMTRGALAQESGPQSAVAPQDAVGTAFTYQGRLLDEGTPVDDTCDFRFNLYDDTLFTPNLVAGPVDRGGVTVSEGNFSTSIDFGAGAFTGEGRQLQILVRCPAGSGSYTTLSGMVWLNPAPYAHSLRPGAVISGSLSYLDGAVLNVHNTYDGMLASYALQATATGGTGLRGESLSSTGIGVEGKAASTGKGVHGESLSGYGVYGEATGDTGVIYGVYGTTNSPSGHGVYGTSPSTDFLYAGVTGANTGGGAGAGVYGYSVGGFGVHGRATVGTGVYGSGSTTGTVGIATSTGTGYGVYGRNSSSSGAGVFGESSVSNGTGVRGFSTSGNGVEGSSTNGNGISGSTSNGRAVWGYGYNGTGVYGTASTTGTVGVATGGGTTYGVYGRAESLSGRGVYGEGGYYGVYGVGTDQSGLSYGVYGETWSGATNSGGVYGYAKSDDGVVHGVQGRTNSDAAGTSGVYGYASASSGTTYGVLGKADSPDGYGVYSNGDAHVEGELTWQAKTSYLSVPPAAFRPEKNDITYFNYGASLSHSPGDICHPGGGSNYTPTEWKYFYAPVFLPHDATITSVTLYAINGQNPTAPLHNNCNTVGSGRMYRTNLEGVVDEMASIEIWGEFEAFEPVDGMDASISLATVDNSQYTYYLRATVLPNQRTTMLMGVVIEYQISEPY